MVSAIPVQFIRSRGHRAAFLRLPRARSPYSVCLPKAKAMLAGGASTALYVGLEVDQTMILCRRRRAKPTRPPQASTRPGTPAPAIGAGTAKKVLAQAESLDTAQMCA